MDVKSKMRWFKITSLVICCIPAMIAIFSIFDATTITLISRSSPPYSVYVTIGEGRLGYITDTDPASVLPKLQNDGDNLRRSLSNQFVTKQDQYHGTWGGPTSPQGKKTQNLGILVDHYSADRSWTGNSRYYRDTYVIPAWLLSLPALTWLLFTWMFWLERRHELRAKLHRGFEVEISSGQTNSPNQSV